MMEHGEGYLFLSIYTREDYILSPVNLLSKNFLKEVSMILTFLSFLVILIFIVKVGF